MDEPLRFQHFPFFINDTTVHVHVLELNKSFVIWINLNGRIATENLAVAMNMKFDNNVSSQSLLGSHSNSTSNSLAQKLCKRTGKQVLVSCNLPETDAELLTKIENQLITDPSLQNLLGT